MMVMQQMGASQSWCLAATKQVSSSLILSSGYGCIFYQQHYLAIKMMNVPQIDRWSICMRAPRPQETTLPQLLTRRLAEMIMEASLQKRKSLL